MWHNTKTKTTILLQTICIYWYRALGGNGVPRTTSFVPMLSSEPAV